MIKKPEGWTDKEYQWLLEWNEACKGLADALGDAKDHLEATTDFDYAKEALKDD